MPPSILKLSAASFLRRIEALPPAQCHALLRERFAVDPELFARLVLPHHCRRPFAPFHRTLFDWHRSMGAAPLPGRHGLRYALAAPRGAAKSTVATLILSLHDLVFGREPYTLIFSATERQARQRLAAIRRELLAPELRSWSQVTGPPAGTASSLLFGTSRVDAYGAGSEVRGLTHGSWRPTKVILDDADPSRSADSPVSRERISAWHAEVVTWLGDVYTHHLAVGTVLHRQALLPQLLDRADYTGLRTRSIEAHATGAAELWTEWRRLLLDPELPNARTAAREYHDRHREQMDRGAVVLWPEKEDYEELMAQLVVQGRRAFFQEKQNEPLGPEDAIFQPERILRFRIIDGRLVIGLLDGARFQPIRELDSAAFQSAPRFGFLDPALGRRKGDFAALAVVVRLSEGTLLLERLLARRIAPAQQVTTIFNLHEQAPFRRFGIEVAGLQELLMGPVEEERRRRLAEGRRGDLPVEPVRPTRAKSARIAALEPLLTAGRLVLSDEAEAELWDELASWPRTRHDDALDALAGAVELAQTAGSSSKAILDASGASQSRTRGIRKLF